MKKDVSIVKIKKEITLPKTVHTFVSIFFVILILFLLIGFIFTIDSLFSIKQELNELQTTTEILKQQVVSSDLITVENEIIQYYRELSDKTDSAISRIISIVGILVAFVSLFSALLAFKAPRDIENYLSELKRLINKSEESTLNAIYQTKIYNALNMNYDGILTLAQKIKNLSEIIKTYPQKPDAYMHRGIIYNQLAQTSEEKDKKKYFYSALSDYEMAQHLGLKDENYYYAVGEIYNQINECAKSMECFNKALLQNPNDYKSYIKRGMLYHNLSEFNNALNDYTAALEIDDTNPDALYNRALSYTSLAATEQNDVKKIEYYELAKEDYYNAWIYIPYPKTYDPKEQILIQIKHMHSILQTHYSAVLINEVDAEKRAKLETKIKQICNERDYLEYIEKTAEAAFS